VLVDLNSSQQKFIKISQSARDDTFDQLVLKDDGDISSRGGKWNSSENDLLENESSEEIVLDPGYRVKGTVKDGTRVIINVCKCDKIRKPSLEKRVGSDGRTNVLWNIPHCFAASDEAKSLSEDKFYNLIVHPDTYRMAETNSGFYKMVNDIAVNELHEKYGAKVNNNVLEIITTKHDQQHLSSETAACSDDQGERVVKPNGNTLELNDCNSKKQKVGKSGSKKSKKGKFHVPEFKISSYPKADCSEGIEGSAITSHAHQWVVEVDLPLLDSVTPVSVNIRDRKLLIVTREPIQYKLEIELPETVNKSGKQVHFDKREKKLTVSLPLFQDKANGGVVGSCHQKDSASNNFNLVYGAVDESIAVSIDQRNQLSLCASDDLESHFLNDEEKMQVNTQVCSANQDFDLVYHMPEYSCHLESTVVSFVFHVKGVKQELMSLNMLTPNSCHLKMDSFDVINGAIVHYSCCLKFDEGCTIRETDCSVHVSDQNVVLLLSKDPESSGNWDYYSAGVTLDNMEVCNNVHNS